MRSRYFVQVNVRDSASRQNEEYAVTRQLTLLGRVWARVRTLCSTVSVWDGVGCVYSVTQEAIGYTALKELPIYARARHFRKLVSERSRIGPKEVAWAGSYRGPKGAKKYFEAIDAETDVEAFERHTFRAEGNKVAIGTPSMSQRRPAIPHPSSRSCERRRLPTARSLWSSIGLAR